VISPPAQPEDDKPHEQQLELGEDDSAIALRKAWERTLRTLATQLNKPTFDNWLRPLKTLSWDGSVVVLGAPSDFARTWVENKYAQTLRASLAQLLDSPNLQVRFVISKPEVQPLLGEKPLPLQQAAAPQQTSSETGLTTSPTLSLGFSSGTSMEPAPRANNAFALELSASPLIDKYTFGNFVVGKSNRLAHAGAVNVAQAPGALYNPLFIYGNPGLGKSHLMHSIGHHIRETLPQARIAYVSGETFTNHYVTALRDKRMEDFRRAYRSVDVWLIDDIQTIATGQKEQTREEFFHTFNTLHGMNRQIVIASDRSPRELRLMDERLRSRFECGLIADIAPPELEMRQAILQKKAALENMRIPEEVIAFMADLIQSNIRALEGALIKLMAYASLARSPVTKQLARDVLSSYFVERLTPISAQTQSAHPEDHGSSPTRLQPSSGSPTVDQIVDTVAAQLGVEREQILSGGTRSSRNSRLHGDPAFGRQAAMYLAKEMSGLSVTAIADAFGCSNRTAVTHAHSRTQKLVDSDPEVLGAISQMRKVIQYNL
jgi:chromosomal replication initiator protein